MTKLAVSILLFVAASATAQQRASVATNRAGVSDSAGVGVIANPYIDSASFWQSMRMMGVDRKDIYFANRSDIDTAALRKWLDSRSLYDPRFNYRDLLRMMPNPVLGLQSDAVRPMPNALPTQKMNGPFENGQVRVGIQDASLPLTIARD